MKDKTEYKGRGEILGEVFDTESTAEILDSFRNEDGIRLLAKIRKAMQLYAKAYALACLEKAANNALVFDHFSGNKEELFDILDANQVDWKITVAKSTINTPDNLI